MTFATTTTRPLGKCNCCMQEFAVYQMCHPTLGVSSLAASALFGTGHKHSFSIWQGAGQGGAGPVEHRPSHADCAVRTTHTFNPARIKHLPLKILQNCDHYDLPQQFFVVQPLAGNWFVCLFACVGLSCLGVSFWAWR